MNLDPNWASPPGATIERLMLRREIASDELAEFLGLDNLAWNQLIKGELRIDARLADGLADALGATSRFWLARDSTFTNDLSRIAEDRSNPFRWLRKFPTGDMINFGWIQKETSAEGRLSAVLSFFGCEDPSEWTNRYLYSPKQIAFRASSAFSVNEAATAAWLRMGEKKAELEPRLRYSPIAFEALIPKLKKLSAYKHPAVFVPKLQQSCRAVGVIVTTARAPKGCRASGATWFTESHNPVIHLSFRHLTDDHFWFTFFHEAGHVILHGGSHIDGDGTSLSETKYLQQEREADAFAQELLLSEELRQDALNIKLARSNIISLAKLAGVAPGIVVGQLEKAGRLKHGTMSFLKRRYRWAKDASLPTVVQPLKRTRR